MRRIKNSQSLILATDIGTSSVRCALFSMLGERYIETTGQVKYDLKTSQDGAAELDPHIIWKSFLTSLNQCIKSYRQDVSKKTSPIIGWGMSCFWHSMLGLDSAGKPATPIYTWADSRCAEDAALLRKKFVEKRIHSRTGCMLRASYWPAKFAWLKRTQTRSFFNNIKYWVSPADYIQSQLTGSLEFSTALSMATATGMWNSKKNEWDTELQHYLGVDLSYLLVSKHDSPSPKYLTNKFQKQHPELNATSLFPAIGDGAAGNLGSGVTQAGVGAINFGTSAAIRVSVEGPYRAPGFGLFRYALDTHRWVIGGATSNAGGARNWALNIFGDPENRSPLIADSTEKLDSDEKETSLPIVLPYLHGERAPFWNENIPSAIVGLHSNHTSSDLYQAWIEAIYLHLSQIIAPLEKSLNLKRPLRFYVSGGITHSHSSIQELCNILGRSCAVSSEPEASLRGAAIYAIELLSDVKKIEKKHKKIVFLKPDRQSQAYYHLRRQQQIELELLLKKIKSLSKPI